MSSECKYILNCLAGGKLPSIRQLSNKGLSTTIYTINGKVKHK